ncbi:hypothetical protein [Arcticibacterium luteifluviistationis]|uniref:Uncharacterized protein n=1 Tax=Arcticibacterium luteifluviistationis TaxID=1784714 RepID=A0A2Z4GCI6_9BACT|nr:hypothetical protein [Arcticibacterium luteifluviistationis]AWV98854.1 hypothetical protein DJ013_12000 [Arcticibacterium luteifluviistationis]
MKYLCSLLILISVAATAQIPYSQKESLIKDFQYGEPKKTQAYKSFLNEKFSIQESKIDRMTILKPEADASGILEVSSSDKMPNPLFKEED